MAIIWHKHHILPKHMGGKNNRDNLIKVNIPMHAFLHKMLWEEHGMWQDEMAWKCLSGQISKSEAHNEFRKKRMMGNKIFLGKKHSEESKLKMGSKKGIKFTEEHRRKLCEARKNRITKESTKEKLSKPRPEKRNIYEVIFPDGKIEHVYWLEEFCKKHDLTFSNILKVVYGKRNHHKHFKAKKIG